jgi:hypothetical protein
MRIVSQVVRGDGAASRLLLKARQSSQQTQMTNMSVYDLEVSFHISDLWQDGTIKYPQILV